MEIKLTPQTNQFLLMCSSDTQYELIIEDCYLSLCVIDVANSIITAQNKVLEREKTALYFFEKSDIRTFTVPQGLQSAYIDNAFTSTLPHRVVIFMVDGDSYSGNYKKNPFHLKHNSIKQITLFVNGQSQPQPPMVFDFEKGMISNALTALYDNSDTHIISRRNFAYGHSLFCFDLCSASHGTSDFDERPLCLEVQGIIRIELEFAKPLTNSIQVMAYGETAGSFNVNLTRVVQQEM